MKSFRVRKPAKASRKLSEFQLGERVTQGVLAYRFSEAPLCFELLFVEELARGGLVREILISVLIVFDL